MSVATELAKSGHRIEWILCIEGIGWLSNEVRGVASGFDGDVFVTNDFEGTLAATLGCTVHPGLFLPYGLSESVDPQKVEWKHGAMRFSVQDQDDTLLGTIRPHDGTGRVVELAAGGPLDYLTPNIVLDEANGTFAEGDVAWIGSSEAVLLGTRSAGGGSLYLYADSTRGYLGTPRGRFDPRPTGLDSLGWAEGTDVRDYNRHWYDRRVHLYMHVPGEHVSNCARVYTGRLRTIVQRKQGIVWDFSTVHDMVIGTGRIRESAVENVVGENAFYDSNDRDGYGRPHAITYGIGDDGVLSPYQMSYADRLARIHNFTGDALERYALGFAYHYRRARGGTAGVKTAIDADPTEPQALELSGKKKISALMSVGGQFYQARHKAPADGASGVLSDWRNIILQGSDPKLGTWSPTIFGPDNCAVRYLIDNYQDGANINRFTFNNFVSRNVVDVALAFMTTCNNEFYVDDSDGSSDTVITFAGTPFADLGTDHWAGFAVHCVDGANIGEARVISASDDSSVTVATPFSNTPSDGDEYQIRNTIYDTLPLGWGLGVLNWQIDIEAWEELRDKYLGRSEVGRFALGDKDKLDVWQVLHENIFQPFGILPYVNRTSGKLSVAYIGEVLPDGLVEDYAAVTSTDILDVGEVQLVPRAPAGSLELAVRAAGTIGVPGWGQIRDATGGGNVQSEAREASIERFVEPSVSGKTQNIVIKPAELESVFRNQKLETLTMKALLNSIDDAAVLTPRLIRHLARYANPPPEVPVKLDISWYPRVHAGQILSITDTTHWNPLNPFTRTRGWTDVLARVIGIALSFEGGPGVQLTLQLLQGGAQAKIAPAALVLSKGSDGFGDFVDCEDHEYSIDTEGDEDWSHFGAGDLIELRSITGAVKEQEVVLDVGSGKVYIVGTWASAIAAGDYITFQPWSNSNTASMDTYCALADANATLGAGNDAAKDYA